MSREWKPGDVGVLNSGVRVFFVGEDMDRAEPSPWRAERGTSLWGDMEIRPLVVIDPEDRDLLMKFMQAYLDEYNNRVGKELKPGRFTNGVRDIQAAFRSLIADPKPEEPTGLGAVVKDAGGALWVRSNPAGHNPWAVESASAKGIVAAYKNYADIDAVAVLSEGVTA